MVNEILKRFEKEYEFLYENQDRVAGFSEALQAGLDWISSGPQLLLELINERQDLFTSDREIAALAFALGDLEII